MKKGLLIRTDGSLAEVEIGKGLADYYRLIETDIVERVSYLQAGVGDGKTATFEAWADEEGYYHRKPFNRLAYLLFGRELVGNIVVHGRSLDKLIVHLAAIGFQVPKEVANEVQDGGGTGEE